MKVGITWILYDSGVALLPFIDEQRLLQALTPLYSQMTPEEQQRNEKGNEVLVVGSGHLLFEPFCALFGKRASDKVCLALVS